MAAPESRRITGPHLLLDRPGAVIELAEGDPDPLAVAERAGQGAARLGWLTRPVIRPHRAGAAVALEAPEDQLYAACAVLDWAVAPEADRQRAWAEVLTESAREANPQLVSLLAIDHSPVFADEDFGFTAGLGQHSRTWPLDRLPDPEAVEPRPGIPFVFLTGTNGKTTTTRMLARIAAAAGYSPGWTSSDAYGVGQDVVESGDWTGPGAARAVLRHPRVDFACLETARGGLLRRGLVLAGAVAAVVTNISADHLGEYGIWDEADMARAKLGVAVGVKRGGTAIVNAADPWIRAAVPEMAARRPDLKWAWFADGPVDHPVDAWADATHLTVAGRSIALADVPATFDGTVRHNVENALAAALAAVAAGIGVDAIASGLAAFTPSVEESRGRMNRFVLPNGAVVLVDFAHNPDGVERVGRATASWAWKRRFLLLGQAGDRSDADLVELARTAAAMRPDGVILKEMRKYLRGRPEGEVTKHLHAGLVDAGFPERAITRVPNERAGVKWMVEGAQEGDLMLMLVQADLEDCLRVLRTAGAIPGFLTVSASKNS